MPTDTGKGNALGEPIKPAPRSKQWMKAGPGSKQAHLIRRPGSKLLIAACNVAIKAESAVGATSATTRCFECAEIEKGGK